MNKNRNSDFLHCLDVRATNHITAMKDITAGRDLLYKKDR
jgi:hypothetical protein